MKYIKYLAFIVLMMLSFQSLAQVHVSIGIGGRIGHGHYDIRVSPRHYHHPYRNYERVYYHGYYLRYSPVYEKVPVYCLDDYGYEYFCGYKLIRREY